jgi:hypothetical protein
MAFDGVFEAPKLVPAPCGLLSVANVTEHGARANDETWVRGFSHKFNSRATVRLLTENDDTVSGGTLFDATGLAIYEDYSPFFIESEVSRSALGVLGEDRFDEALKKLEAATQKAVERELWAGSAALAASNSNNFLTKTGVSTIPVAGAHSASDALFHLEQAIAESPTGTSGVIHMTRDVASILGAKLVYIPGTESKPGRVMTRLGTDVIIGSGYTGAGPVGNANAAASLTNRWMFATGALEVHLSKSEIVNENLAQGINARINDMIIKGVRAAAVYFDPSIHFAMRVSVPALA